MKLFTETMTCDAMVYLDYDGKEMYMGGPDAPATPREAFLRRLVEDRGYMLYIGGGLVPLRVAVMSLESYNSRADIGENDAVCTFEEWALSSRPEELCENPATGEYEYELVIQPIPRPQIVMPETE